MTLQGFLASASAVLGGGGGFLQAELKVSPGEMLEVLVGGGGGVARGEAGGAGGFNGGQPGGWIYSERRSLFHAGRKSSCLRSSWSSSWHSYTWCSGTSYSSKMCSGSSVWET